MAHSLRLISTNTSKGAKGLLCPWPVLRNWCHQQAWGHVVSVYPRPHAPRKFWPVFLKSSTRSLHLLRGNHQMGINGLQSNWMEPVSRINATLRLLTWVFTSDSWHYCFLALFLFSEILPRTPLSFAPTHPSWFSTSTILKNPWEEAGTRSCRFPCILDTPTLQKAFPKEGLSND